MHATARLLLAILLVAVTLSTVNQVRKPTKWVGRFVLWMMNLSHSSLTDWGLTHVRIEEHFTILDVGCGGGRTIQKLAAMATKGMIYGVDYAEGSVIASRAKNAPSIQSGQVEVQQASVSRLPFPEGRFDLVTAVETQYYWPDPVNDMREILRVLKPGGKLMVIAESYKSGTSNKLQEPVMKLLRSSNMDVEGHRGLFSMAGYTDVQIFEERKSGWICGVGEKLAPTSESKGHTVATERVGL
jgi:SAM-dependent methyltransferase